MEKCVNDIGNGTKDGAVFKEKGRTETEEVGKERVERETRSE
jgi:hypothetical protein